MKKERTLLLMVVIVTLTSCAGMQTVSQYNGIAPEKVDVNGKCFQIYLKTFSQSAYVDECPMAAIGKAYLEGLTFGIVDTTPPEESHVNALKKLLDQKGMKCIIGEYPYKIRDGMGGALGYEIKYDCNQS